MIIRFFAVIAALMLVVAPAVPAASVPTGYTVKSAAAAGVQCNGVKDDTVAIQSLMNKAAPYTAIQLPAGTCVTSKSVAFSGKSNVALIGAGKDATIIKATNEQSGSVRAYRSSNVLIADIQVYYPSTKQRWTEPAQDCFSAQQSDNVTISGVKGRGCAAAGVKFIASRDSRVESSIVDSSRADAFHAWASRNITMQGNTGINMGDDCLAAIGGHDATQASNGVKMFDNRCSGGTHGGGIHFDNANDGEAQRNIIDHVGVSCAAVTSDGQWSGSNPANNILIAYNTFIGCVVRTITGHASMSVYTSNKSVGVIGPNVRFVGNRVQAPTSGAAFRQWGPGTKNTEVSGTRACGMGSKKLVVVLSGAVRQSDNSSVVVC